MVLSIRFRAPVQANKMELQSANIAMSLKHAFHFCPMSPCCHIIGMRPSKLVFLINRLPSPNTQNKSPFQILFNRFPYYTILKSFGFLCYPFMRSYNKHKIQYKSVKCFFFGLQYIKLARWTHVNIQTFYF